MKRECVFLEKHCITLYVTLYITLLFNDSTTNWRKGTQFSKEERNTIHTLTRTLFTHILDLLEEGNLSDLIIVRYAVIYLLKINESPVVPSHHPSSLLCVSFASFLHPMIASFLP